MKIKILKIYQESFVNVFTHKLEWTRVACGPILVGAIGVLLIAMIYMIYGNPIDVTGEELSFKAELFYPYLVVSIVFVVTFLISIVNLYINGYRYVVLQDGKDQWITLNFNKRSIKLIFYGLLFGILFVIYSAVCGTPIVGAIEGTLVIYNPAVAITLGILLGLVGLYLFTRLSLFMIAISLDQKAPFKTSWHLMKDNVWRLFFLTLLLSITSFLLETLGGGIIEFIFKFMGFSETLTPGLVTSFFSALIWLVAWAVGTKATSLAYQQLSKK